MFWLETVVDFGVFAPKFRDSVAKNGSSVAVGDFVAAGHLHVDRGAR